MSFEFLDLAQNLQGSILTLTIAATSLPIALFLGFILMLLRANKHRSAQELEVILTAVARVLEAFRRPRK